jgi:hypothetical protein
MPAEECCKLVKKEIPSIDEDLYSYLESKFFCQRKFSERKVILNLEAILKAAPLDVSTNEVFQVFSHPHFPP